MKAIKVSNLRTTLINLNFGEYKVRFWSLAYMVLYASFGIVDYLAAPVTFKTLWLIRACVIPYFLLALLSTYVEVVKPYRPLINAIMVFMAPFSIILMIASSDPVEWSMYIYFAGIVLTTFPIGFMMMNTRYTIIILIALTALYFLMIGIIINFYNGDYYFFTITSFFVISSFMTSFLSTLLLEGNQTEILVQKGEVEELVETKNRLINILAHDLRGPCSSIVGFSDLFLGRVRDYKMEDAEFFMKNINLSANNLLSLLQNLLEWSRIQTNTHSLTPTTIALDELVESNVEMVKDAMALKDISLKSMERTKGLQVVADKQMVDTVFRNLLTNAVKFSRVGGRIDIRYWSVGSMVYVSIKDNGVGIQSNRIEKLFEVSSAKSTRGTKNEPGSGLGLVLCREFIVINDGQIWVSSEEGKGSIFTFSLPLKKAV